MKKQMIAAIAAFGIATPVLAQGHSYVDGFFAVSEIDVGPFDDDGTGFGLKGAFQVADQAFLSAEYQSIEYDDTDTEIDEIRLGGLIGPGAGSKNEGIYGQLEYVNLDFDGGDDQDGFGGHVGYSLPLSKEFRVYGQAGYLVLDDLDGPEILIGGTFQMASNIAIFADFRNSFLDVDGGGDVDLSTFRAGVRFLF